jgi:hypothetical protein
MVLHKSTEFGIFYDSKNAFDFCPRGNNWPLSGEADYQPASIPGL